MTLGALDRSPGVGAEPASWLTARPIPTGSSAARVINNSIQALRRAESGRRAKTGARIPGCEAGFSGLVGPRMRRLLGLHAQATVQADHLSVQVAVAHDVSHQGGVFIRTAQAAGE